MNIAVDNFTEHLEHVINATYVNGGYWLPWARQMVAWCERNCVAKWSHTTSGTFPNTNLFFLFENSADAVHFKLVWL
jgi:hypothetical protein